MAKLTVTLTHKGFLKPSDPKTRETMEVLRDLVEEAVAEKLREFEWMPKWVEMSSRISVRKGK